MAGSVPVARRNVLSDRRRLLISAFGVGVAVALILLLEGFWGGLRVQIAAYEDNVGANLFVGEKDTRNFLSETSVVNLSALDQVRGVPGVVAADPVLSRFTILDFPKRKQIAVLVGYQPGGLGGPWRVSEGRAVEADGELVMDETVARQVGVGVGDEIEILGERFRVVGLSAGTRAWMMGYVFVTFDAAGRLLRAPSTASFILVKADSPAETSRAIGEATGLEVLTPEALAENDRRLFAGIMGAPLNLMVAIAFAAGTLIIALSVYSSVVERLREYGIAKAMGARGMRIFRIVVGQTLALAAVGAAAGFVLFLAGARLVVALQPQFWTSVSPAVMAGVLAATGLMGLIAAALPVRRIARLDPATVYRGG